MYSHLQFISVKAQNTAISVIVVQGTSQIRYDNLLNLHYFYVVVIYGYILQLLWISRLSLILDTNRDHYWVYISTSLVWQGNLNCIVEVPNNKLYSSITSSFTNKTEVKECIDQRSVKSHQPKHKNNHNNLYQIQFGILQSST